MFLPDSLKKLKKANAVFAIEDNLPIAAVSVAALKNNAEILKELCAPSDFYAVIKADAYGHGLIETARAVENIADGFAVGCVAEGAALRQAGVLNPILCLIPADKSEFARAEKYSIKICINDINSLIALSEYAKTSVPPSFHLAVNSGMNRLGINDQSDAMAALKIITENKLPILGVFSHFYNACDFSACEKQFLRFLSVARVFKSEYGGIKTHICSGGGLFYGDKFKLDCVRAGLALYGYGYPLPRREKKDCGKNFIVDENIFSRLEPALKIYAPLLQSRSLKSGESLLYGDFKLDKPQCADILSYGYYYGEKRGTDGCLNYNCMNLCAAKSGSSFNVGGKKYVCVMSNAQKIAQKTGASVYNVLTRASKLKKIFI